MMGNGKNNNGNGNYNNNYNNNYNSFLSITNLSAEDIQFEVDGQTYVDCGPAWTSAAFRPAPTSWYCFPAKKAAAEWWA